MAIYDTDAKWWVESIRDRLYDLGDLLYTFSYDRADHFILKYVVTWVTMPLWRAIQSVCGKMTVFASRIGAIHNFAQDLLSGWLLDDLIEQVFEEWKRFRRDPVYYIIGKISEVLPDFYWFVQDPLYMLEFWLGWHWAHLKDIFKDESGWVFYMLRVTWPDFYWLVQDPAYMVSFWLSERFPFLRDFFSDPLYWFKSKLADLLNVPMDFYGDPWGWILYIVKRKLDEKHPYYLSWLRSWGESVLRFFYEGKF